MEINDFIGKVEALERYLENGLQDTILVGGNSMAALIANRVINTGKTADGGTFTPYSTKKVPAYLYRGKSRNASGEARVQKAIKQRTPLSYRDFREANNLPTSPKNFSFTNDMWSHFGAKDVKARGGVYTLTIGGTTAEAAKKIEWLSEQEGKSIIEPNKQEADALRATITREIVRRLR